MGPAPCVTYFRGESPTRNVWDIQDRFAPRVLQIFPTTLVSPPQRNIVQAPRPLHNPRTNFPFVQVYSSLERVYLHERKKHFRYYSEQKKNHLGKLQD